nr:DNA recombination protein RmuC [Mycoplasmopsis bovis]
MKLRLTLISTLKTHLQSILKNNLETFKHKWIKLAKKWWSLNKCKLSVDDLNRTFSNNKKTGDFGEFTLEQILEEHYPNEKEQIVI